MTARLLDVGGEPRFLLGVNYWSRAGGPRMWESFDEGRIRAELAQMRSIGLNVCRSFAFIPSFMPRPPTISRTVMARFRRFLELCAEEQLGTIPSLLVGHMSGENWDFPGQRGRNPYTDRTVLGWEQRLTTAVATCGARQPAVWAYLASNEMPYWGGPAEVSTVVSWATALRRALREKDRHRPFGIGDGVMNLSGGQNGFDPQALGGLVDFVGPHTYYTDEDEARQAMNAEYCLRSLTHLGLPVLLEEFGCSAAQASEANQVLYYREAIHACLGVGAAGALGWCFSDFDLAAERPYSHHAFELQFGITRADGSEKPVCQELRELARLIQRIEMPRLQYARPTAAILVPSFFNVDYPFSAEDRTRMRRVMLQSYLLAASAGLEVELCPEGADLAPYQLILCPSTQKLLTNTWQQLLQRARAGASVYWSYFMGDLWQQGAWCHNFEELTGCRHQLRYGCYDQPADPLRIQRSALERRSDCLTGVLEVRSAGNPRARAFLPIQPLAAEVLACDGQGRPALTRMRHGQGQVFFLCYPLECYLAEQATGWSADGAFSLYRSLAEWAGLRPAVRVDDAGVQCRVVDSLLFVFNHRWETVSTTVDSPGGEPLGGGPPLAEGRQPLVLPAKSAAVYRLRTER